MPTLLQTSPGVGAPAVDGPSRATRTSGEKSDGGGFEASLAVARSQREFSSEAPADEPDEQAPVQESGRSSAEGDGSTEVSEATTPGAAQDEAVATAPCDSPAGATAGADAVAGGLADHPDSLSAIDGETSQEPAMEEAPADEDITPAAPPSNDDAATGDAERVQAVSGSAPAPVAAAAGQAETTVPTRESAGARPEIRSTPPPAAAPAGGEAMTAAHPAASSEGETSVPPPAGSGDVVAPPQATARGVVEIIGSLTADSSPHEGATGEAAAMPAASGTKHVEPVPVARGPMAEENIEQVVASVRSGLAGGKSRHEMTVRLDPPALGSMRIRMEMVEGQLTATFSTSSEVTHRLMQQSLPQLRTSLEQAGFPVDRLQVLRTPETAGSQGSFLQNESGGGGREQMQHHQRDQQRRETLIRLWRTGSWSERQINLTA